MRIRAQALVLALCLLPATARAQTGGTSGGGSTAGGGGIPRPVAVNQALMDRLIPLLQEEGGATSAFWWDQRSARGMTKQEYTAAKNTLFIARLDAADAARLSTLPFDDGSRAVRQANAAFYRGNKAKIDAALARVHADGCGPACSASSPPPARSTR